MSAHHDYVPTREEIVAISSKPVSKKISTLALAAAGIGLLVFVIGLFVDHDAAWRSYHQNWLFWTTLSAAGVMFVAVQRIVTARWSRSIIRFLEGYVAFLPIAIVLLIPTFLFGSHSVFPWTHEAYPVHEKAIWYNPAFLIPRDFLILGLFTFLAIWYISLSVRLDVIHAPDMGGTGFWANMRAKMRTGTRDERREIHSTHSTQGKIAVAMAIVFGYGFSSIGFDLAMGLSLHFQSTLYGWWFFMSGWVTALFIFTLLTLAWRRHLGADQLITDSHFHDLGKLCFAFTAFFGYLSFSQFLIIWYGNLPEETHWPRLRFLGGWAPVTLAAMAFAFFLPFLGLVSKAAKLYKKTLVAFVSAGIIGQWLVRYLEVYPQTYGERAVAAFGFVDAGVTVMFLGIWGLCYIAFMNNVPKMRLTLMTSPYRDEVQVPCNPETMEPLPAHE